jgi:hypothetical protein
LVEEKGRGAAGGAGRLQLLVEVVVLRPREARVEELSVGVPARVIVEAATGGTNGTDGTDVLRQHG